jgi:uncharacterized protein (DUF3084 family)
LSFGVDYGDNPAMADADRLIQELDWLESMLPVLKERARGLRVADEERVDAAARWQHVGRDLEARERRLETGEEAFRERERALAARERLNQDAVTAQARLTEQLEKRTVAFERQVLELEAATEQLRVREVEVNERAALLDQRSLAVSERGVQLDDLARDLAQRAEVVVAHGKDLERFADRVRQRDAELDRREQELARREGRATEIAAAAENAAWMLKPLAVERREGTWTIPKLQRFVSQHAADNPRRVDEWRAYLRYLNDFADVDGRLPSSLDGLIDGVFSNGVRGQIAQRVGGGG